MDKRTICNLTHGVGTKLLKSFLGEKYNLYSDPLNMDKRTICNLTHGLGTKLLKSFLGEKDNLYSDPIVIDTFEP